MKKTYLDYSISPRGESGWWDVFKNGQFLATVPNEEEARRCIWMDTGKGDYITDEMMEIAS